MAANASGEGLRPGWRGLEIDKTVAAVGLSARIAWW
jgi:hypothetical protein